jgi:Spy/CpxP family protein refolding chaperone
MGGAIAAMVVTIAAAWPALAGQADGPRGPRGPRMARILTQDQMEQVRPWLKAERDASQPLMALHRQLRDAVLSEAPDQGKIAALQSQIGPLQAEALTRRTALAQRIAALLTAEQRQQLRSSDFVPPFLDPAGAGHPGGMGPHGHKGGGGPGGPPPAPRQ